MMKNIFTVWIILSLSFLVCADTQDLLQVEVQNKSQVVLRVFKTPDDLTGFLKIWEDKALLKGITNIGSWDYLLDIQTKVTSLQWRYDSKTGLCSPFSPKKMPLYRIRNFEILNKAIQAMPHQKIAWQVEDGPLDLKHEPWIPPYDPREGRREFREQRGGNDFREKNREEGYKNLMPDFKPSLESDTEEESEDDQWQDASRPVYISLKEARRRRDASRARAESDAKKDAGNPPGIREIPKE